MPETTPIGHRPAWWSYFKHPATESIRQSLRWTFVWAFGHYLIFGAVAALSVGLQVAVLTLPIGTVIMVVPVALPLAYHLTVARQVARPEPSGFSG